MAKRTPKRTKKAIAESASALQDVIDSAEELLESLKDQPGAAVQRAREKISTTLKMPRDRLEDLKGTEVASDAFDSTVRFLKSDPWRTVAIGALAVLVISLVVRGTSAS
jgi:ElaB/YqjD/DUF883 family membrane-anchored ribosome-binding protein